MLTHDSPSVRRDARSPGQVLVLFALFLLVLLGISALAIDYASWLLVDRNLQNVADHAALAGASEYRVKAAQGTCSSGAGQPKCRDARIQAWTSLNSDLQLGLLPTTITCLATAGPDQGNSPAAGESSSARASAGACTSDAPVTFPVTIWVSTPPPDIGAYKNFGGRYALNFGVIWVRVDRDVHSFLGGALGIRPNARSGWASAGALPTGYALQTFCRNGIAPQSGVCVNSAGLSIDGQGGIRLLRGDIASNESLKVTAQGGSGVVVENGEMYLVNDVCSSSTWNCPNSPPLGGISDGVNAKNAFYMAPLPVPKYQTPLVNVTVNDSNCTGADATHLCVPYRPAGSTNPGDWQCEVTGLTNLCGTPCATVPAFPTCVNPGTLTPSDPGYGSVRCDARVGGTPSKHLVPASDGTGANAFTGIPAAGNGQKFTRIDDDSTVPDPDTTSPPVNPSTDYDYIANLGVSGGGATQAVTMNLRPPFGIPVSGSTTISYVAFKTFNGTPDAAGNPVTLTVALLRSGSTISVDPTTRTLDGTSTLYQWTVASGVIGDYTNLALRFTFTSSGSNTNSEKRGGAIAWAEATTPDLQPALPAMIPPGYYHSILIKSGGCAVMDPTAVYSGLMQYQMPGIYQFGSGSDAQIKLESGAYLIGDGVTLVFNPEFPNPAGGRGIIVPADGAMVLNTMRVPGTPQCTPTETELATYNPSTPLTLLPVSGVCAAWGIDPADTTGIHSGSNAWPVCVDTSLTQCVERSAYAPTAGYRGVTFYFSWNAFPATATTIRDRFSLGGGSGAQPGLAFRGILYAPYDNVKITGGNGFNTVGQVLSWTAKFNGGSAYIDLDYPYQPAPAAPYLLEPTVNH